jgi:hypothetical protein
MKFFLCGGSAELNLHISELHRESTHDVLDALRQYAINNLH